MPDVRMPDGTIIRNVPEGTTKAELQGRYQAAQNAKKPKSFFQGVAEGVEKPLYNLTQILSGPHGTDTGGPLGLLAPVLGAGGKLVHSYFNQGKNASPYRGSPAGHAVGQLAATAPLPGGPISAGLVTGAMMADNPNNPTSLATSAATGAISAKIADTVTRKVVAPAASKLLHRINGNTLTRAQQIIANSLESPDAVAAARQNITDAQALNLPYALADANPKLRALAGSATRFSPDALAAAEDPLVTRSLGQVDRATGFINDLAPVTDIAKRGEAIRRLANMKAGPLYESAMSKAVPWDQGLADVLNTPAGMSAMQRGYEIAANQGKNLGEIAPEALSTGELQAMPSYEALQATKRGLDSIIEGQRNPITGVLNTSDPKIAALNTVRAKLLQRMGDLNPDYATANKTYSDVIGLKTALDKGISLTKPVVTPSTVASVVKGSTEGQVQQLQRGYATQMAKDVANASLSRNPYEAVAGSAAQQQKLGTLFPGSVDQFLRAKALEGDMAKTAQEVLGGSPTARRMAADASLKEDVLGGLIQNGAQIASGGGINPVPFLKAAAKNLSQFGIGQRAKQRAADVAATLLSQDGSADLPQILSTAEKQKALEETVRRYAASLLIPGSAVAATQLLPQ